MKLSAMNLSSFLSASRGQYSKSSWVHITAGESILHLICSFRLSFLISFRWEVSSDFCLNTSFSEWSSSCLRSKVWRKYEDFYDTFLLLLEKYSTDAIDIPVLSSYKRLYKSYKKKNLQAMATYLSMTTVNKDENTFECLDESFLQIIQVRMTSPSTILPLSSVSTL